jgi:hypothetical protein
MICDGSQNSHLLFKWPLVHSEFDIPPLHLAFELDELPLL